jgi:antitoxin component of MazEF toxin-antitoxin module
MRVKTRRVGNSLTVTIPKDLVDEMDLTEDTDMNIFVREGSVVLEPVTSRWDRLVERVREETSARSLTEADVAEELTSLRARGASASEDPSDEAP